MNKLRSKAPFAKRSFGQNFLVDSGYVQKIVESAQLSNNDTVLEIGPGRGALTRKLVDEAGRLLVVELDADLLPVLKHDFGQLSNFELIHADILKLDLSSLNVTGKVKIVANLPYYISTAVLQHLIRQRQAISEMVLMLQREVVDRIVAKPGTTDRGFLTVLIEAFLDVDKLFDVPPSAFRPSPKVWSSVVRATPKSADEIIKGRESEFEGLVSAAFRQKRKTIFNNLKAVAAALRIENPASLIERSGIDPGRRAESLTFEEWRNLLISYTISSDG